MCTGYTPFERDTPQQEIAAIMAGDFRFEPEEYWGNVSDTARTFIAECLTVDAGVRPTAAQLLQHKVDDFSLNLLHRLHTAFRNDWP